MQWQQATCKVSTYVFNLPELHCSISLCQSIVALYDMDLLKVQKGQHKDMAGPCLIGTGD